MISVTPKYAGLRKPWKGLERLLKAGFENMSLDFDTEYSPYNLGTFENKEPDFNVLIETCRDMGVRLTMARAPYLMTNIDQPKVKIYRPTDPMPPGVEPPKIPMTLEELTGRLVEVTLKCVETAGRAGCECIVVQPLFAGVKKDEAWKVNHDYYMRLGRVARENNIMVLLENLYRDLRRSLHRCGVDRCTQQGNRWERVWVLYGCGCMQRLRSEHA
jgi:hypothetical protein